MLNVYNVVRILMPHTSSRHWHQVYVCYMLSLYVCYLLAQSQNNLIMIVLFVCLMVFNATFNNISVISWQSVLLVEETGAPGENHRPATSH